MAASTTPVFVASPESWIGRCSVANANRDGTGTIVTLVTPGADGSLVEAIEVSSEGTTTAGYFNLYLSDDSGTTWRFWRSIVILAAVPTADDVDAWQDALLTAYLPLPLATTQRLGGAATVAGSFVVTARGGNY